MNQRIGPPLAIPLRTSARLKTQALIETQRLRVLLIDVSSQRQTMFYQPPANPLAVIRRVNAQTALCSANRAG